ncbi:MAG: valine--pyruvate transaminase [Verrucomicrobiota bacterium]
MKLSQFGKRFTAKTGIMDLMEDLGRAMNGNEDICMLGGGNPAHIPEVNAIWRKRMEEILASGTEFEKMLANYDTPQGKWSFIEALAQLLNREFGWPVGPENIAITNSSQSAFFYLFNLFSGETGSAGKNRILFPQSPEYIGYADQAIDPDAFISCRSAIEMIDDHTFKYCVDFDNLRVDSSIAAMCVSRPTNPTGNVLTDEEIKRLSGLAAEHGVPFLIDNAYGTPFPEIIFRKVTPFWNNNIIMGMSLSKLGLPSVRTGIIVANKDIIDALSAVNAIVSLASGSIGQVITQPLVENNEILRISREIIRPFYLKKSRQAVSYIHQEFDDKWPYAVHLSEGALFLWIMMKDLPVTARELYEKLKQKNVLVIPGNFFFFGLPDYQRHQDECIRLTYSQPDDDVYRGIDIIAGTLRELYG